MKAVQLKVRTFIREQRKSHKRVTGQQVTEFLIHEKLLFVPVDAEGILQPIELLWAHVKGRVGRQYNSEMTLHFMYEHLMHEFQLVEESRHEAVQKYIDKCSRVAEKMYQDMDDDDSVCSHVIRVIFTKNMTKISKIRDIFNQSVSNMKGS